MTEVKTNCGNCGHDYKVIAEAEVDLRHLACPHCGKPLMETMGQPEEGDPLDLVE